MNGSLKERYALAFLDRLLRHLCFGDVVLCCAIVYMKAAAHGQHVTLVRGVLRCDSEFGGWMNETHTQTNTHTHTIGIFIRRLWIERIHE